MSTIVATMEASCSRISYDVFLSFRGEDTRKTFTDHLYKALEKAGINTFRDADKMENGSSIGPACIKAIEESKISIVIISKGYASSTWCSEELVHILECRKTRGHIAWPIFYDVRPSDLEGLKGSFKDALEEHKSSCSEADLEKWKNALKEIAYLKGLRVQHHKDGHEAENVEHIVDEIARKLDITELDVATHQVGDLDASAAEVISFLDIDSKGIRIVGILGTDGIGKTSLAKHVYNKVFGHFDGCSFLENVNQRIHRLETTELQTILLNDVLGRENGKISSVAGGKKLIQERLKHRNFLLVLDDIHSLYQINEILGGFRWFPERSRVIVTTRTRNLLRSSDFLYKVYEMKELSFEDSLRLLSLHEFATDQPHQNYCYMAKELVKHCRRNPGALVRVGFYLNGKQIDEWKKLLNDDVWNGISKDSEVVSSLDDYLGKIMQKETHDRSIGVCYGRRGISVAGQEVIDLCKKYNISRMRLYEPNREILDELRHTDIEVMLGVPNGYLERIASSQEEANAWVKNKVKFYENVRVRYIAVGNQVVRDSNTSAQFLLPAMENVQNGLSSAGLNNIKVSTAVDTGILEKSFPPSKGRLREEAWQVLDPILQFLMDKQSPLLVNVHPYFSYKREPQHISLEYALFTAASAVFTDYHPPHKYHNLFDATVDAVYAALEKKGFDSMEIVVSESGWPTAGDFGASVDNASTYVNNLIQHIKGGTPRRPDEPLETYILGLFDENKKAEEVHRHWGLFDSDKQPKYSVNFI